MTTTEPATVPTAIASAAQPSGELMSCCAAASAVTATSQYTARNGTSLATLPSTKAGVARGPRVGRGLNDSAMAAAGTNTLTKNPTGTLDYLPARVTTDTTTPDLAPQQGVATSGTEKCRYTCRGTGIRGNWTATQCKHALSHEDGAETKVGLVMTPSDDGLERPIIDPIDPTPP